MNFRRGEKINHRSVEGLIEQGRTMEVTQDMAKMKTTLENHMNKWDKKNVDATQQQRHAEVMKYRQEQFQRRGAPTALQVLADGRGFMIPAGVPIDQELNFFNTLCDGKNRNHCQNCGTTDQKLKYCSGCKIAAYCNEKCQHAHWKTHKSNCSK